MIKLNTMIQALSVKITELGEWLIRIFAVIIILIEDLRLIMVAVPVLVIINQITGVWKAIIKNEFNWQKFNTLYIKLILYFIAIVATFIYEHFVLGLMVDHYFSKGLGIVIGFQELSSCYLNVTFILGKDFIAKYLKKIK